MSKIAQRIHDASERVWGTWWLEIANIGILFGIAFMFVAARLFERYGFGFSPPLSTIVNVYGASTWAILSVCAAGLLLTVLKWGGLDVRAIALGACALIYFGIGTELALIFGGNLGSACYIPMGFVCISACAFTFHRMWDANCRSSGGMTTPHAPH